MAGGPLTPSESPKRPGVLRDPDPRSALLDTYVTRAGLRALFSRDSIFRPQATSTDRGEIAVIQDEGDIVGQIHTFTLRLTGLRLVPNASGGYDYVRIDPAFRPDIGSRVTLADDDSVQRTIPFAFSFYGRPQVDAYVNSDGNITFGEPDNSSAERNVSRLLTGAPRVAPFLADLDPSVGGGVFVRSGADALTATWCDVRVFDSTRVATMQTSILPDGSIEIRFADVPPFSARDGVVGISPGHTANFLSVNFAGASTTPTAGGNGALTERFASHPDLDLIGLARKFYETHPDNYDQLVVWTDTVLTFDAFSFETTIANEVTGIGVDLYDLSRQFGSGGRLRSMVQMDDINKFPDDPATKFLGENNTLSVMGQEAGHRWLAFMRFRDHNRNVSSALLGRDRAHWSFFLNSDASVMEGNRIQDLGGGLVRTTAAVEKYSALDQYAMGLLRDGEVPPFFYVESPTNAVPFVQPESAPRVGVTFNGTRRDVLVNDVVDVLGPRRPLPADSPKVHRQAFIYVVGQGRPADANALAKLDRIRRGWEAFFLQATDGRMRAETRLFPTS